MYAVVTGLIDDTVGLEPRYKFLGQIVAALAPMLISDVSISFLGGVVGSHLSLGILSIPLTLFWIVGITNAIPTTKKIAPINKNMPPVIEPASVSSMRLITFLGIWRGGSGGARGISGATSAATASSTGSGESSGGRGSDPPQFSQLNWNSL